MKSSCNKQCKLDSNNVCISCNRHIDVIIAKGKGISAQLPEQPLYFIIKESSTIHSQENIPHFK